MKITVLNNNLIDIDGVVQEPKFKHYALFIKRGVRFIEGAEIETKTAGRPKLPNMVQKTIRIDKKHVERIDDVAKALNISDKILEKLNEGQEADVKPYTADDISPALAKFWTDYFKKTVIILLFPILGFSQTTMQQYFYGSQNVAGAEMIVNLGNDTFLGAGFSGTLKNSHTKGEWAGKYITADEMKYSTGVAKEEWCSLYAVGSLGYFKNVLVSFNAGAGLYGQMRSFERNGIEYHKNDKLIFVPLVGATGQYSITKDIGLMAGYDTFNGLKIGLSIEL